MSFSAQKITDAEIAAAGVVSRPNKLTGTAAQNKAVFDALVKNLVKIKLNALVDELLGANAASQIGVDTISGLTAATVQAALEEIVQNMQGITQGAVADGSITTAKIADTAVTEAKLGSGSVTEGKIGAGAVTEGKLGSGAVTSGKIGSGAVEEAKIANGAVTENKLGALAVTTGKIANAAVDNTKLAAGAVTAVKLAEGAVTAEKLASDAVGAAALADGSVTHDKIGPLAVDVEHLGPNVVTFPKLRNFFLSDAVAASGTVTLEFIADSRGILFMIGTTSSAVWALSANGSNTVRADCLAYVGASAPVAVTSTGEATLPNNGSGAARCLLVVLSGGIAYGED